MYEELVVFKIVAMDQDKVTGAQTRALPQDVRGNFGAARLLVKTALAVLLETADLLMGGLAGNAESFDEFGDRVVI